MSIDFQRKMFQTPQDGKPFKCLELLAVLNKLEGFWLYGINIWQDRGHSHHHHLL
jgi:hypothetical protein